MKQKDVYILAIESSCDETSMSIIKNGCVDISTTILTQMDTHASFGGVVPEIASRMHSENITMVLEDVFSKTDITMNEIHYSVGSRAGVITIDDENFSSKIISLLEQEEEAYGD